MKRDNNIEKIINNRESLSMLGKTLLKKIFESTTYNQTFIKLLNECERKNKTYIDNSFPPNENSLVKGYFKSMREEVTNISKKWAKIKWMRAHEIIKSPVVFGREVDPNEVKQGALNNCSFLSVLAAISEFPDRIRSLFLTDTVNRFGIYGVKLCIDGVWMEVVVDDFFPCDAKKGLNCFSSGSPNSIWVQIIEKCYAKAYGSYHKIEIGSTEQVLRDLTGATTFTLDNSFENLLTSIKDACEKRWIITASSGETSASKDLLNEVGLISMHGYTILQVIELNLENDPNSYQHNSTHNLNTIEYLLQIRNPLGKNQWIGEWSDYSNLWKDNINFSNSNGCFYMNFKDFKHYFSKINICKVFDNYKYNTLSLRQDCNSYNLVKIKILNDFPTHTFISLIHPDKRKSNLYMNTNDNKYFISRFIVAKIKKNESYIEDEVENEGGNSNLTMIEYIGGKMGQEREISDEKDFEAGEYLIFIEIDWFTQKESQTLDMNKSYPFVFSTYSNNNIILSELNKSEFPDILQSLYKSCSKKSKNVQKFANEGAPNCYKYTDVTKEGYAYIFFDNKEDDATLIEDVKYTKFEGLKLLPPFSGTSYYVKIAPKQTDIVLIKQVDMTGFNLIYSYHSNFLFGPKRLLELTKQKGKKNFRKDTKLNIDVEIVVYTYKYSLGLCFYYENNTADRKLEETLKIKSSGVQINDSENNDNSILIVLGPGESRLIELAAKKNNWSVQSSVSYKIESV